MRLREIENGERERVKKREWRKRARGHRERVKEREEIMRQDR